MQEIEDNLLDESDDEAVTSGSTKCDGVRKRLRKNDKFSNSTHPMELSESNASPPATTRITDAPAKRPNKVADDFEVNLDTGCPRTRLQGRLSTTSEREYLQQPVSCDIISDANHPISVTNKSAENTDKKMRLIEGSKSHFKGDQLSWTTVFSRGGY